MANRFADTPPDEVEKEQPVQQTPASAGEPTARITVTPAPRESERPPNRFAEPSSLEEPKPAPSTQLNKVFGELKPSDESPSQWLKWKIMSGLGALGAPNYTAQRLGNAAVEIPKMIFPPAAIAAGGLDAQHHSRRGQYGEAAFDMLGMLPSVFVGNRLRTGYPRIPTAETPVAEAADYARQSPRRAAFEQRAGNAAEPRQLPESLEQAKNRQYAATETPPVVYHPDAGPNFSQTAQNHLRSPSHGRGVYTPESDPDTFGILQRFGRDFPGTQAPRNLGFNPGVTQQPAARPVTPRDFDVLRQELRAVDTPAAHQAANLIDAYMVRPPSGMLSIGTQQDLNQLRQNFQDARGNYRSLATDRVLTDTLEHSGIKAATRNSGLNAGNITRQDLEKFVTSRQGARRIPGATAAERDQIVDVATGDRTTNALRTYGNLTGAGGGMGRVVSSAAGAGGGYTAAKLLAPFIGLDPTLTAGVAALGVPLSGAAARSASTARTLRAADDLSTSVRRNSPLFREREAVSPPMIDPRQQYRDAMAMALIPPGIAEARDEWEKAHVPYANR